MPQQMLQFTGLAVTMLFLGVLSWMYLREQGALKARRRRIFEACAVLLDKHRLTQDGVNFPVLAGAYGGYSVRIEPLADHVAFRKIPSLWLVVTLKHDLPIGGAVDLLARAQNVEFYSPADDLPLCVDLPRAWPCEITIKAEQPAHELPLRTLEPHVQALFADPHAKELLVTPRGVRIVYQAHSADRAEYLVLRAASFREPDVSPVLLRTLLDRAVGLCGDLMMRGGVHARA